MSVVSAAAVTPRSSSTSRRARACGLRSRYCSPSRSRPGPEQFAAEANTMAELADHPNIVQIFRSDVTEDGRPYLVMKYYPQRNLAVREATSVSRYPRSCRSVFGWHARLRRPTGPASSIGTSSRPTSSRANTANLVSPTSASRPRVVDQDAETEGLSIPWSPPEVVFSKSPGDRSSDVYSLGATLWHLLVGHSPFEEPGRGQFFVRIRPADPRDAPATDGS